MTIKISSDRLAKAAAVVAACCSLVLAQAPAIQQEYAPPQPAQAYQPHQAPAQQLGQGAVAAALLANPEIGNAVMTIDGGAGQDAGTGAGAEFRGGTLRQGTTISAQALASAPYLFSDRDAAGYMRLGNAKLETLKEKAVYQKFDNAVVKPTGKTEYRIGDTVDIVSAVKTVKFKGKTAQLVMRKGRAVVEGGSGGKIFIKLIELWGVVKGGESIVPTTKFTPIYCERLVTPETKIEAAVVMRVEETAIPYMHQHVIIDKGSNDGIQLGDFFRVRENAPAGQISEETIEAQVVSVTPSSATLVILKLFKNSLKASDSAYISRRPVQQAQAAAQTQYVPAQSQ